MRDQHALSPQQTWRHQMILTVPVFFYQLFFVLILFIASRFGRTALTVVFIACLLWTTTHLFFLPLAILQTLVIVVSYLVFSNKRSKSKIK